MTKKTRYFMAGSAAVLAAGLGTGMIAYFSGGFQPVSASAVANELRYVPANSTLVAYADVRAIMDSDLRARLKAALPMHQQGQKEFQDQTGIDIERDIDYIVASLATGAERTAPLVVARGRFNDTQLEGVIREHGGTVEQYKGKRLVLAPRHQTDGVDQSAQPGPAGDSGPMHELHARAVHQNLVLAFLEPGLIAFGDGSAVKTAIDAQLTAHSITSNTEMMDLVKDIGATNNAWAVGRFDLLSSQSTLPEQVRRQLPPVKWFAAAGHVNGGVSGSLRAEALDDKAADNLRDVVRGFLALARMQAQVDPRTAAMVESLQLTGAGKTVALSFTVPAEILEMIPKAQEDLNPTPNQ
ncbi:MAG: hypothetical protein M3545_10760 [Acidobacteriota bacterium]|nr:hypothetical protein [Acidobacteriota bacterium]